MRPSFYMRKYWVKPGKKRPLCIRVHRKGLFWVRPSCNAFLSGKSWQYFVAMHPRRGPGQENRPFVARYRRPCIQNELVLARYVLHVFKMPCKAPFGNTSRGYLAIKAPFSRPNPSNHAQWANIATLLQFCLLCEVRRATSVEVRPSLRD